MKNSLWTKDFSIITLGTVVSMLGNAVSGFAIGLLVLDYTGSVFLYTTFIVAYNLPKVIMPIVAGPFLDRFSRKRMIYSLDFLSAGIYACLAVVMHFWDITFPLLLVVSLFIGTIDSVYRVAYDSFYPNVIPEGFYRQAYSVSSMLDPLAIAMVPVSAYIYERFGMTPLFAFNAASFFIAAVFETRISAEEKHVSKDESRFGLAAFRKTFREGIEYIKAEKGLLAITVYFAISMFCGGSETVILPWFRSEPTLGVYMYCLVMGIFVLGRLIGGFIQYRLRYPADKKYLIAVTVYGVLAVISGSYLYAPLMLMTALSFISGLMSVTSYNIRIAATQSYVPDSKRARFNGSFQMLCNLGQITGQLTSGALADRFEPRYVISAYCLLNLAAVFAVMLPNRKHVEPIYNQDI